MDRTSGAGWRFNPPPGWPQAPADWQPTPGWTPPADWPPMPPGWQLWLPAESPQGGSVRAASGRTGVPWHHRTWGTLLLLVLFFPVGLYLMWRRQPWRSGIKWTLTGAVALFVAIAAAGSSTPSPTPASKASVPLASQPASLPVTTSASQPAVSIVATTSAPSPTRRPATTPTTKAPVVAPSPTKPRTSQPVLVPPPTTVAPPVQHSSAPISSCYPLTNGGNCYEPGEFCRKSDHGATGIAGNGERIVCRDNNGWRWEPV